MDQKHIGLFLKELRKQQGLTQGQLAERLNVSDRTVSRWETGNNMPDLSILVELADYYEVDIREIIDGERKSGNMDKELKDTLQKVADYSDVQKHNAAKAGNNAFGITFIISAITIVVQLLVTGKIVMVIGETIIFLIGGMVYLNLIVRSGAFDSPVKNSKWSYTIISVICAGIFSVIMALFMHIQNIAEARLIILYTAIFFVVMAIVGRAVLALLGKASDKNTP